MIKAAGIFLLMLLKLCGWLLLILLLFLLAVLLLAVLVPVGYYVEAENNRGEKLHEHAGIRSSVENIRMQFRFTWLFHLIYVSLHFEGKKFHNTIRVAGIDVQKLLAHLKKLKTGKSRKQRKEGKKKADSKKADKKADTKRADDKNAADQKTDTKNADNKNAADQKTDTKNADDKNTVDQKTDTKNADNKNTADQKTDTKKTGKNSADNKKPDRTKTQTDTAQVLKQTMPDGSFQTQGGGKAHDKERSAGEKTAYTEEQGKKNIKRAVKEDAPSGFAAVQTKVKQFHKEFTDETNRSAVMHLWKEFCVIITHYKPKKLKADLVFSLADPALTGRVLGLISLAPVIYRYPCSILPDFESEAVYIEGYMVMRGRISVGVFLISLLRLLRDEDTMKCARRLMGRGR